MQANDRLPTRYHAMLYIAVAIAEDLDEGTSIEEEMTIDFITEKMQEWDSDQDMEAILEEVQQYFDELSSGPIQQRGAIANACVQRLEGELNDEEKDLFFRYLYALANADGEFSEQEESFLVWLSVTMGLPLE